MAFSYSFHLSAKSHCVSTIGKIGQCSRHNLREYKSENYDRSQIEILVGSEFGILSDVKKIYRDEFSDALEKYNAGKRSDRRIDNYLEHVSNSRSDVAAEIIIQIGDKDFWSDKSMEQKKQMSYIFTDQLRSLQKLCPEFKIASAVVHYDESSPHMHLVGVPIAEGYKKGMEKQVAKTKVFTADRLSYLQDKMRLNAEKGISLNPDLFAEKKLKAKEKGRNKDIPKSSLTEYYELQNNIKELEGEYNSIYEDAVSLSEDVQNLRDIKAQVNDIESIETHLKGFGANKRVEVQQNDWERVKNTAQKDFALRHENDILTTENNKLERENDRLKNRLKEIINEKESLIQENKTLQIFKAFIESHNLIDKVREWYRELQNKREKERQERDRGRSR